MPQATRQQQQKRPNILVIYTGGTFGMDSPLRPAKSEQALLQLPRLTPNELKARLMVRLPQMNELANCDIDVLFNRDSAHIGPEEWIGLADRIQSSWDEHDGFVILHGTDTLPYTASALSFLLNPCKKPVVITGAQLPLSSLLTDARRNLLSAIEIAAYGPRPLVSQVTLFFDDRLLQGNRSRKRSASEFEAFDSPRAEPIAWAGTRITFAKNHSSMRWLKSARRARPLKPAFNGNVAMLHLTPGFPARIVRETLLNTVDALILIAFPSGTAPTHDEEFVKLLREAKKRKTPVITVTESAAHATSASPVVYEAGQKLLSEGCFGAGSMTPECAYVKAALLLGQSGGKAQFGKLWKTELAAEGA